MRSSIFLLALLGCFSIVHSQGYERIINQFSQSVTLNTTALGSFSLASGAATPYTLIPSGSDVITSAILANGTNITTTTIGLTVSSGYTSFVTFLDSNNSFTVIKVAESYSPSAMNANQSVAIFRVLDFSSVAGTISSVVGVPSTTTYFSFVVNTQATNFTVLPLTETSINIFGSANNNLATIPITPVGGQAYTIFLFNTAAGGVGATLLSDHPFNNTVASTTGAPATTGSMNTTSTTGSMNTTGATTGEATTGVATTGAMNTTGATTGESTTGAMNTTGATTGEATTGVATTGATTVATTGVATTGHATTGAMNTTATTGRSTTGRAANSTTLAATTRAATTGNTASSTSAPVLIILACVAVLLAL